MEVTPLFFFESVYICLLYPSFAFDILYIFPLCVWGVLEWFSILLTLIFFLCVCECVSWDFLCVSGSVVWSALVNIFLLIILCVYVWMYLCMFLSICLCEWFMLSSTDQQTPNNTSTSKKGHQPKKYILSILYTLARRIHTLITFKNLKKLTLKNYTQP